MPNNRINVELELGGEIKCQVWDNNGTKHDVTHIFQQIRGRTSEGGIWSELTLKKDVFETTLKFIATAKELTFDTTADVINQILQMSE